MAGIINGGSYVADSIGASRTFQEVLNIQSGNTKYGCMASLISNNIVTIDEFARFFAGRVGAFVISDTYKAQYNKSDIEVINYILRNFHSKDDVQDKEAERTVAGFFAAGATEFAIKVGARALADYMQKQENFETYSQVYRLLYSYVYAEPIAETNINNINRAERELHRIRRQFRLSDNEQRKINDCLSEKDVNLDTLTLPVVDKLDATTRENIAYLLSALHYQKFEEEESNDSLLLEYYDFLGFHGNYAKELAREQKNNYIYVSNEQNAYLAIARGMVTQFDIALPYFDINELILRSQEMAKFDPYKFKTKKKPNALSGNQRTVAEIYYKRPDYVLNAAATAVSQFLLDDMSREFINRKLSHWGIEDMDRDTIFSQGEKLRMQAENENV